ncbi:MAG: hypothetical protein KME26_04055 [Oscillatoria princeps RMCB-10]|nr:hypothetical protein [Oscillatoria princeps RMCB-10]
MSRLKRQASRERQLRRHAPAISRFRKSGTTTSEWAPFGAVGRSLPVSLPQPASRHPPARHDSDQCPMP